MKGYRLHKHSSEADVARIRDYLICAAKEADGTYLWNEERISSDEWGVTENGCFWFKDLESNNYVLIQCDRYYVSTVVKIEPTLQKLLKHLSAMELTENDIRKAVGTNIANVCALRGYSMDEVCSMLDVSKPSLYKWFSGETTPPIHTLFKVGAVLGVEPSSLLEIYYVPFGGYSPYIDELDREQKRKTELDILAERAERTVALKEAKAERNRLAAIENEAASLIFWIQRRSTSELKPYERSIIRELHRVGAKVIDTYHLDEYTDEVIRQFAVIEKTFMERCLERFDEGLDYANFAKATNAHIAMEKFCHELAQSVYNRLLEENLEAKETLEREHADVGI